MRNTILTHTQKHTHTHRLILHPPTSSNPARTNKSACLATQTKLSGSSSRASISTNMLANGPTQGATIGKHFSAKVSANFRHRLAKAPTSVRGSRGAAARGWTKAKRAPQTLGNTVLAGPKQVDFGFVSLGFGRTSKPMRWEVFGQGANVGETIQVLLGVGIEEPE